MEDEEEVIKDNILTLKDFVVDDIVFTGVHQKVKVIAINRDSDGNMKWITFKFPGDNYKTYSPYEARNFYKKV